MENLNLSEAFRALPKQIQGNGIEVFIVDSTLLPHSATRLTSHMLAIVLDGSLGVLCNDVQKIVKKDEATMIKKGCALQLRTPEGLFPFRSLVLFFDEPSLRYALLPFELPAQNSSSTFLNISLNEKLKVFAESILLYYNSAKEENNWATLLQNKLRELIWIFFHTDVKEEAKEFFSTTSP